MTRQQEGDESVKCQILSVVSKGSPDAHLRLAIGRCACGKEYEFKGEGGVESVWSSLTAHIQAKLPTPEDETTLPAIDVTEEESTLAIQAMRLIWDAPYEEPGQRITLLHAKLEAAYRVIHCRERQLRTVTAERDALKAELLLHVNRTLRNAVVGQETPQQAWERAFEDGFYLGREYGMDSNGAITFEIPPYTPPLKAGQ